MEVSALERRLTDLDHVRLKNLFQRDQPRSVVGFTSRRVRHRAFPQSQPTFSVLASCIDDVAEIAVGAPREPHTAKRLHGKGVHAMTTPPTLTTATDFSECAGHAAHRAALLAEQMGAALTLLHVIDRSFAARLQDLFGSPAQAQQSLTANAARTLDEHAADLTTRTGVNSTLPLHSKVTLGSVHDELLAECLRATLLVLGAHGESPLRDLLLGSTAERLLRYAACPVLVVRRAPRGPYRRVLVPADFSPASAVALDLVERFAPGAAITVVHAFDAPFEGKFRFAGVSDETIAAHRERAHREALAKLAALEANRTGPTRPSIVERQHPVQLILDAEKSRDADLIVIGRQGQSMVEEFLLGSVARRVLADAQCDVLVTTGRSASA